MEFLRFGSSIPGTYWGCCACCIIQNFHCDPDSKSSIQVVDGDCGYPILDENDESIFVGKTYRDIFWQRIRFGTFSDDDMPNHAFFAILTESQLSQSHGKKWLAILKEAGFEFIRTVDNSVYSGQQVIEGPGKQTTSSHPNYIFGMFRNIGKGAIKDPYTPPKAWTDLNKVVPEVWERIGDGKGLNLVVQEKQLELWKALPEAKWYTRKELEAEGVPVMAAGLRSENSQENIVYREQRQGANKKTKASPAPFSASTVPAF